MPSTTLTLALTGLDCADCARTVERGLCQLPGVLKASASFPAGQLVIEHTAGTVTADQIAGRIRALGFDLAAPDRPAPSSVAEADGLDWTIWRWRLVRFGPTALAGLLWLAAAGLDWTGGPEPVVIGLYALAIGIGGARIARNGLLTLLHARTLGIDLLMTVAALGAMAIGEWSEAAAVVVLFALGEALEGLTVERARRKLRGLLELAPRLANRRVGTTLSPVAVATLQPGDIVGVRPGERFAADGRLVLGQTSVNQAPITGESLPVAKAVGDPIYAGTLNGDRYVEFVVEQPAGDSLLARITQLVETAQANRAPIARLVDRFAQLYTPAVLVGAGLVAVLPPLLGQPALPWFYRALAWLVIACPCALVLSTPVAIVAAMTRATRAGVLVKGGAALEALAAVRAIAFDKTGTLTSGQPTVTDLVPLTEHSTADLLGLAAAVESRSEHPLAGAILAAAAEAGLRWAEPDDFQALPGRGARAVVAGQTVTVGNRSLFATAPPALDERLAALQTAGKTALIIGIDDQPVGLIGVADTPRPTAAAAVARLAGAGRRHIVMLTGDHQRTADAIGARVGITDRRAALLPADKSAVVVALRQRYGAVAMVGDGINDAPALATATVGIAMAAAGSDTALETADVALMSDDLSRLPGLIALSERTLATIRFNIGLAIALKLLFLALTTVGVTSLWLAILADTGATLLVLANSLRLLRAPLGD